MAVLCLSLVMVVIDNTVLTVAVPSVMTDLPATVAQAQWAVSAYLLALSSFVLVGGAAADRWGPKQTLMAGLMLFGVASLAAAFSSAPWQLIAARSVMGLGAALMMPSTLAVAMRTFSEEERPKAIGIWMAVAAAGTAGGPVLGGFLIATWWWGTVFLINVPISVVCMVAVTVTVPDTGGTKGERLDWIGACLSVVAMVGLVWAITTVPTHGWTSTAVQMLAAVGVLALVAFILWELQQKAPMLDLALFRNTRFSAAVLGGLLASFGMAGSLFVLTQHFQMLLNYSPVAAGTRMLPLAISMLFSSALLSALLLKMLKAPGALLAGMSVVAAGLLVISLIPVERYVGSFLGLILVGLGMGVAGPVATNALMSALPVAKAGTGSGVGSTIQEFGNGLGVAVLGAVLTGFFVARIPASLQEAGKQSFTDAMQQAASSPNADALSAQVRDAFGQGLAASQSVGALAVLVGGIAATILLWRAESRAAAPSTSQTSSGR
ncbi:MFS transporter [Micromonospora qiuiae]|uniref:MFS transporter n=2 Tax=Micromonospora qiuiae TaxID=502268 RepID=A0ABQ4JFT4_9ACTN|nr:MFS transporter [Micromonospora qiuiae]